jgi:2-polyprenyl-3-methyl-5-hydroxy-6-metoxy-1,4-benzoquinol methylase
MISFSVRGSYVRCESPMDPKTHWEKIYSTKAPNQVTWYSPHLETSLVLIHRAAGATSASIIDVGAGESTLVDDLLARGYQNITILDISQNNGRGEWI